MIAGNQIISFALSACKKVRIACANLPCGVLIYAIFPAVARPVLCMVGMAAGEML